MVHPLYRRDGMYVTPSIVDARFYASAAPDPVVYEVVPEGEILRLGTRMCSYGAADSGLVRPSWPNKIPAVADFER